MAAKNIQIHPYEASGGASVEIDVASNSVRIESHEDSFALIVPTSLGVMEAWEAISPLLSKPSPDNEAVIINDRDTRSVDISSIDAIERLAKSSEGIRLLRLDLNEHVFVWRTLDGEIGERKELGVGFEKYDAETLGKIVRAAGVLAVSEASDDITQIASPLLLRYS
jgi:hypothetical protein